MTKGILAASLRLVAWEVTRSCNLACAHCRASSNSEHYADELSTAEGEKLLDEIASIAKPIVILTGGEPLIRNDIFTLAAYGTNKGLPMALATNGTLVDSDTASKIKESGIRRVSISIDGKDDSSHDSFRGVPGALQRALAGIESLKKAGVAFQINTTITSKNIEQIEALHEFVVAIGAVAHHIFLLVPTGRGRELSGQEITAQRYEETLLWFYKKSLTSPIELKATCAPHYFRIFHQLKDERMKDSPSYAMHAHSRGCLGGISFCFISHRGVAQPCGYFEMECGNVRKDGFAAVWQNSRVFQDIRNLELYTGKCGVCEFLRVCGGCRARALSASGDYLTEEPLCSYQPRI